MAVLVVGRRLSPPLVPPPALFSSCLLFRRPLQTSMVSCGFRDKFVSKKDLNKRPSDLEIKTKDLPKNTPTLGDRIMRDRYHMFHQWDRRGGYYEPGRKTGTWRDFMEDLDTKTFYLNGYRFLRDESKKYFQNEFFRDAKNPFWDIPRIGDTRIEWTFEAEDSTEREWKTVCDSFWGEGYSTCALERSADGRAGIFSGELSTRVPRDGRIKRAGYCNMATLRKRKAFNRPVDMKWQQFTDLLLWIRGDGRTYRVNLHCPWEFDIGWHDVWSFPLFTRGGPYWQYVRIPFAKFLFTHRGFVQDKQMRAPLFRLHHISITLADRIDGPFRLEVQKIGVYKSHPRVTERFRYETYYLPYVNFDKN